MADKQAGAEKVGRPVLARGGRVWTCEQTKGEMMKPTLSRWLWLGCLLVLLAGMFPVQAFYNPTTGRWLSRDPIEEKGGVNLYGFTDNRPVGECDGDGQKIVRKIIKEQVEAFVTCRDAMKRASANAMVWFGDYSQTHICCYKQKKYTVEQWPGFLPKHHKQEGFLILHCLVGYFARLEGVSEKCLAAANAKHEWDEFWGSQEWNSVKSEAHSPWGWYNDTIADVVIVFAGYEKAKKAEDCIPRICRFRK